MRAESQAEVAYCEIHEDWFNLLVVFRIHVTPGVFPVKTDLPPKEILSQNVILSSDTGFNIFVNFGPGLGPVHVCAHMREL